MIDREKVIKGLEHCTRPSEVGKGGNFCMDCPYTEAIGFNQFKCNGQQMKRDALSLLKEQEAKKVLQIRNVAYRTIGYCPSCGRGLDSYKDGNSGDHITNYCYNCGQAVKWE